MADIGAQQTAIGTHQVMTVKETGPEQQDMAHLMHSVAGYIMWQCLKIYQDMTNIMVKTNLDDTSAPEQQYLSTTKQVQSEQDTQAPQNLYTRSQRVYFSDGI